MSSFTGPASLDFDPAGALAALPVLAVATIGLPRSSFSGDETGGFTLYVPPAFAVRHPDRRRPGRPRGTQVTSVLPSVSAWAFLSYLAWLVCSGTSSSGDPNGSGNGGGSR
jgi:hypothetical protein